MRLIELTISNVKRVRAVHIRPDRHTVVITGKNGAGKSSVLDAFMYALAGKSSIPGEPIRKGAETAEVIADLGDIVVTRKWTQKETYLTVEGKDGTKYKSPQALLDRLTSALTFDPLAFTRLNGHEQAETLRRLANLDFSELDAETAKIFEHRKDTNRLIGEKKGAMEQMPTYADVPDTEVSLTDLVEEHQRQIRLEGEHDETRRHLAEATRVRDELATQYNLLRDREAELTKELEDCRNQGNEISDRGKAQIRAVKKLEERVDSLVEPAFTEVADAIKAAEETNKRVRANNAYDETVTTHKVLEKERDALSARLSAIKDEKREAIAAADMPVDGLSFDETGVRLGDVPFDQASTAEQLTVSVAMGLAQNPKLRVMQIRDGSLLDEESMGLLEKLAEKHDAQILIERVEDSSPACVLIEDGYVADPEALKGRKTDTVLEVEPLTITPAGSTGGKGEAV